MTKKFDLFAAPELCTLDLHTNKSASNVYTKMDSLLSKISTCLGAIKMEIS